MKKHCITDNCYEQFTDLTCEANRAIVPCLVFGPFLKYWAHISCLPIVRYHTCRMTPSWFSSLGDITPLSIQPEIVVTDHLHQLLYQILICQVSFQQLFHQSILIAHPSLFCPRLSVNTLSALGISVKFSMVKTEAKYWLKESARSWGKAVALPLSSVSGPILLLTLDRLQTRCKFPFKITFGTTNFDGCIPSCFPICRMPHILIFLIQIVL